MFTDSTLIDIVLRGAILATIAIVWVVICVRILGLRSFSKMTSFDFVMTVAVGSLLAGASQATEWAGFAQPVIAIASLFVVQFVMAYVRRRNDTFEDLIGNCPTLLMKDGEFIEPAMRATRVSREDMVSKLREANVMRLSEVRAAVLEATGDVSVMHGDSFDESLIENVKRID